MHLIAAWVFPACPELTSDSISHAVDLHSGKPGGVAHVFLREHAGWFVIGIFMNGPARNGDRWDVESVREALATLLPAIDATIVVELVLLPPTPAESDLSHRGDFHLGWGG
jgi:hypothetical protein